MMDEERLTGEVKWTTYTRYFKAVGSWWWAVVIGFALITEQAATVGNSLMLGYWSDGRIAGFAQGEYMVVYAGERKSDFVGDILTGQVSVWPLPSFR
jgi:hypothetical protein